MQLASPSLGPHPDTLPSDPDCPRGRMTGHFHWCSDCRRYRERAARAIHDRMVASFNRGMAAAHHGAPESACPFTDGPDRDEWIRGWHNRPWLYGSGVGGS